MNQPEEQQPPVGHDLLEIAIATHGEWVRSQYDGSKPRVQREMWEKSVEARADVVAHLRELRRMAMADYRTAISDRIATLEQQIDAQRDEVSNAMHDWAAQCESRFAAKQPTDGAITELATRTVNQASAIDLIRKQTNGSPGEVQKRIDTATGRLRLELRALAQQVARLDPAAHRSVTFDIPDGFDANALIAEMQTRLKTGVRVDEPDNNDDWFAGHVERTDADKVIAADWEAEQTRVLRLLLGVHPNRLAEGNLAPRSQASAALMADAGLTEYSPAGQSWMITGKGIDWLNERGV